MGKWASKHRKSESKKSKAYSLGHQDGDASSASIPPSSKGMSLKLAAFQNPESITCLDTKGNCCISGSADGTILLQNVNNRELSSQVIGHEKEVTKVKAHSQFHLSASRDKLVKIWEAESEKGQLAGHSLGVTAIDCNEDFSIVWSGSRDNTVKIWDVETLSCINENKISRNLVTDVCYSSEMNILAQTSEDRMLKLWDPRNLEVVHTFPLQSQIQTSCSVFQNYCVTTNNGFSNQGCEICVWDIRGRTLLETFKKHTETVSSCKFIGPNFVSCSHDGTIRLWEQTASKNWQLCSTLHPNVGMLTCLSILNNETLLCGGFGKGILLITVKHNQLSF